MGIYKHLSALSIWYFLYRIQTLGDPTSNFKMAAVPADVTVCLKWHTFKGEIQCHMKLHSKMKFLESFAAQLVLEGGSDCDFSYFGATVIIFPSLDCCHFVIPVRQNIKVCVFLKRWYNFV